MTRLMNSYKNGNYFVKIYSNGTKIRFSEANSFSPKFPENIDLKITNWCNFNCPMCHEGSSIEGKVGDIMNLKFIDSLTPGTEIAIGGGKVSSHPKLILFLKKLKKAGVIANITIQQKELIQEKKLIKRLIKDELVYGIGVSFSFNSLLEKERKIIRKFAKLNENIVFHVINGIFSKEDFDFLKNESLKVLILGYKTFGRGAIYEEKESKKIKQNQDWLEKNIKEIIENSIFKVISFDNLALEQLKIEEKVSEEIWKNNFMGEEGQFTMYIDGVSNNFGRNSIATVRYPLKDSIEEMFEVIRNENP